MVFSRPVEEVHADTTAIASLLSNYAAQNARAEAVSLLRLLRPNAHSPPWFLDGDERISAVTNLHCKRIYIRDRKTDAEASFGLRPHGRCENEGSHPKA